MREEAIIPSTQEIFPARIQMSTGAEESTTSFFLRFPNEVIAHIFMHCLPDPDVGGYQPFTNPQNAPYLLTNICRRLTHLAWSTPSLWASFSVRLGTKKSRTQSLQTWLARAGRRPLTIRVYAQNYRPNVLEPIISRRAQWKHISLTLKEDYLHDLFDSDEGELPYLETLRVFPMLNIPSRIHTLVPSKDETQNKAPRLRKLTIIAKAAIPFRLPWVNLRVLEFSGCFLMDFHVLLPHITRVQSITLDHCLNASTMPAFSPETLPALQHLVLRGEFQKSGIDRLLESLTLPVLSSLQCVFPDALPSEVIITSLESLLLRSDCLLRSFGLEFDPAAVADLTRFFQLFSSIENLSIRCQHAVSSSMLQALTWTLSDPPAAALLPKLSSLKLGSLHHDEQSLESELLNLLLSRRGQHGVSSPASSTQVARLRSFSMIGYGDSIGGVTLRRLEDLKAIGMDIKLH